MKNNVRFLYIICTVALIFVAVFSIVSFVIKQSANEPNFSFSLVTALVRTTVKQEN